MGQLMVKRTLHLPTKLFISLTLGQLLVILLITSFVSSILFWPTKSLPQQQLTELSQYPASITLRIKLIQTYLRLNNYQMAQNELNQTNTLLKHSGNTLGASSETTALGSEISAGLSQKKRLETQWLEIANNYPLYRDAWVQLLYLAFNKGDLKSANIYLDKIKALDANFGDLFPDVLRRL